jgi:glucose/arabinose dehydrogenase
MRARAEEGTVPVHIAAMAVIAATAAQSLACPPAPPAAPAQPASLQRPTLAACTAAAPARGASFTGTVLQVIDGRTLCVANGPTPDQWVRVRLTDANPTAPRGALMAAAFAKQVVCVAAAADGEGVQAVCEADGQSVGAASGHPDASLHAASWR